MSCKGLHCGGCGDGRGGGRGAIALVLIVVIGAVIRAAWHAITGAADAVVSVAEITACVLVAVAGAAAVGGIGYGVLAARRRAAAVRGSRPVVLTAVPEPAGLDGYQPSAAIEPPRTGVSAYPRIDAQPHVVTSRAVRPRCAHRDERRP